MNEERKEGRRELKKEGRRGRKKEGKKKEEKTVKATKQKGKEKRCKNCEEEEERWEICYRKGIMGEKIKNW